MSDFVEVPEVYQVQVYDYLSGKTFVNKQEFNTYDEAQEFIKTFDFDSDFGKNPIGISIITMPKIETGDIKVV